MIQGLIKQLLANNKTKTAMQRPQDARYYLSIIIPAFNEEQRLEDTLNRISRFVETQSYSTEIIVVNNASSDGTDKIISDFAQRHKYFRHLYEPVRGKGASVRTGVFNAWGEYLLFCDADLAVPIEEVNKFLPPLLNDYAIAIGSREVKGANRYNEPYRRHLIGRIFNIIVQSLLLPGIRDTQCGFKCFRRDAALDLFSLSKLNGWCFDAEILYIALINGYKFIEIPIDWFYREYSSVNLVSDPWHMLMDVFKIRSNMQKGLYNIKKQTSL